LVYFVPHRLVKEWPWGIVPRRRRLYFKVILESDLDFKHWEEMERFIELIGEIECQPIFVDRVWEALFSLPK
jgi:hypothetical protein